MSDALPQFVEGARVAQLVEQARREEREACAKVCEDLLWVTKCDRTITDECALQIRART